MESPINPAVNRTVFHCAALALSAGVAISLLRERWAQQSRLDAELLEVKKAATPQDTLIAWKAVLQALTDDQRAKKCAAKISLTRNIAPLMNVLKSDASDNDLLDVCLKVVQKAFGIDDDGRRDFNAAGGCRVVLSVLARAHKANNRRVMEDAATTLQLLTEVDDSQVVLPSDVPSGAESAYQLSQYPSAVKMLRTLEPNAPIVFLNAVTGIFSNFAALHDGAKAIHRGVEGHSGIWYFLRLLSHHNHGVVENSARTVSYLVRAGLGHDEVSQEDNLGLIADLISVNMDPKTVNAALTVIVVMLDSQHAATFFANLEHKTNALQSLFSVWCRASDKVVRERAEVLVRLLERLTSCGPTIRRLIEANRSNIMERKAMDEEARRRQMQQMQKQQMMQQMMMQQMGGMGGMGGDMEGMMGME